MRPLGEFAKRFVRLHIGLFIYAFSISLMLEASLGLDPWSALHEGLANRTGYSFGVITQLTGLAFILMGALALRVRPGLGTLFNMAVIGPWLDLVRVQAWFPRWDSGVPAVTQFVAGMLLMGVATGLYIGARLGAGPRDGFVLGLAQRSQRSVRSTRVTIELLVLATGWLIGGTLGLGTVLFALGMGPIMQASLHVMKVSTVVSPVPARVPGRL